MKIALFLLSIMYIFISSVAFSDNMSPIGTWQTIADSGADKGKAVSYIEIFKHNGLYFGKIKRLLLKPADTKCDKCKGTLKNKPIVGMTILSNLKKNGNRYSGGRILDPANGKTYRCYMQVLSGGKKLKVRGYIGFSLLGRTQYWYRVK